MRIAGLLEAGGVMVLLLVAMARVGRRAPEIEVRRNAEVSSSRRH